jgi:hypothetical protein
MSEHEIARPVNSRIYRNNFDRIFGRSNQDVPLEDAISLRDGLRRNGWNVSQILEPSGFWSVRATKGKVAIQERAIDFSTAMHLVWTIATKKT